MTDDIQDSAEHVSHEFTPDGFFSEVKELYAGAWNIFKERYISLIAINLIPVIVLFAAFASVFSLLQMADPQVLFSLSVTHFDTELPAFVFLSVIMLLIFFVSLFVASWSALALIRTAGENVPISITEAYQKTRTVLASYWWMLILLAIIICGSFVFFIIPSIIFYIFFLFSPWVLVFEEKKGMDALLASRQYVLGRWWNTLGHLGAIFITPVIISIFASILNALNINIIGQLFQIFVEFFYPSFAVCYLSVLYHYYKATEIQTGIEVSDDLSSTAPIKNVSPSTGYLIVGIAGTLIIVFLLIALIMTVLPLLPNS